MAVSRRGIEHKQANEYISKIKIMTRIHPLSTELKSVTSLATNKSTAEAWSPIEVSKFNRGFE